MAGLCENLPPCHVRLSPLNWAPVRPITTRRTPRYFSSRRVNTGRSSRFHLPLRNSPPARNFRRLPRVLSLSLFLLPRSARIWRKIDVPHFSARYQRRGAPASFLREECYLGNAMLLFPPFTSSRNSCEGSTITDTRTRVVRVQARPVTIDIAGPIVLDLG